jgi:hypothetical protein
VPDLLTRANVDMGDAFAGVYLVAAILVGCCLIPAFFLPRSKTESTGQPIAMH